MKHNKKDDIIQERIKKLLKSPPRQKLSDTKKSELFARLYKNEEVPSIMSQLPNLLATYNKFLDEHTKVIKALQKVIDNNPETDIARIAQRDIGSIYERKLKDPAKAREAYRKAISNYPRNSRAKDVQKDLKRISKKA